MSGVVTVTVPDETLRRLTPFPRFVTVLDGHAVSVPTRRRS